MKKYIKILLLIISIIAFGWVSFADAPKTQNLVAKKTTLVRATLQSTMYNLGFDLEHDGNLLLEKLNLQEEKHSSYAFNQLFRFLKKLDRSNLVHMDCKVWIYQPLKNNYYKQIGMVVPFYNDIVSYRIWTDQKNSSSRSQEYLVGTGDVDMMHDNCSDKFAWKDDKSAQCARRMRTYFAEHEFQITKCK